MISIMNNIQLSRELLNFFNSNNILFSYPENDLNSLNCLLSFDTSVEIEEHSAFLARNHLFSMGSFSYSFSNLPMDTKVGRYCSIGGNVTIFGPEHPLDRISTSSFTYDSNFKIYPFTVHNGFYSRDYSDLDRGRTIIENDVWIGTGASIKRGCRIANGAVIGANAVVTKDVPAYAVVVGNPAKVIKFRFQEKIIARLLQMNYWEYEGSIWKDVDIDSDIESVMENVQKNISKKLFPKKIIANDILDAVNQLQAGSKLILEQSKSARALLSKMKSKLFLKGS